MKQVRLDKYFVIEDEFEDEFEDEVISLKVCDQMKGMTQDEYNNFISAWVD